MRRPAIVVAAIAAAAILPAMAAPVPIAGRYITEGGKALVELAPCGPALCGRILRVLKVDPSRPTVDLNNPDPRLKNRPIAGMVFLTGFTAASDHWKGRIYDPESGRTYRSELRRTGDALKVKGCFGPFCRTQNWSAAR